MNRTSFSRAAERVSRRCMSHRRMSRRARIVTRYPWFALVAIFLLVMACGHPFEPNFDHPFWDRGIVVLAHKGGLGPNPENTIPAFQYGLSEGADGVELDVQLCASGEVVVFHDYEVDELTDGTGTVTEMQLAELKALRYDYASFASDPEIPTLEEVIAALPSTTLLDIELKGESAGSDGLEAAVARIVYAHGLQDRTIITSFNPYRVKRVENDYPGLLTGLITGPELFWYVRSPRFIDWCRTDAVIPFSKWADRDYLGDRPDHRMVAWFEDGDVADPAAEYQRLLSLGVDGFVTDHPALVVSLLPGGH